MLYFNQSIYIHCHIETPCGVRRLGGGGIWQFRPETMELEVFVRGLVNPWGHHFDRWGQAFATDGAGGEGINYVFPAPLYATAVGADAHPARPQSRAARSTAAWRSLSGRHLPEDWQGNVAHQRFPRPTASAGSCCPTTARLRLARAARADHDRARRLPADRRQDGPRRRHLHRRLVQPDHPARRGRLPRSPPRPHPRPHLAHDGQGPTARQAAGPGERDAGTTRRRVEIPTTVGRGTRLGDSIGRARPRGDGAGVADGQPHEPRSHVPRPPGMALGMPSVGIRSTSRCWRRCCRIPTTTPAPRPSACSPIGGPRRRPRRLAGSACRCANAFEGHRGRASPGPARSDQQPATLRGRGRRAAGVAALDKPLDENLDYALWLTCRELRAAWLPEVARSRTTRRHRSARLRLDAAGAGEAIRPALRTVGRREPASEGRAASSGADRAVRRAGGTGGSPSRPRSPTLSPSQPALAGLLAAARERGQGRRRGRDLAAAAGRRDARDAVRDGRGGGRGTRGAAAGSGETSSG